MEICRVEKRTIWCVLCEERSQDSALRRIANWRVVERIDERRHAEHVGEEDKLLAERGARLAGTGEEVDRAHPFVRGEAALPTIIMASPAEGNQQDALCLRDELMELANEILEDEPDAPGSLPPERFNVQEWNMDERYARVWRKLCKLE